MIRRLIICTTILAGPVFAEELLLNPSFEIIEGDAPAHWNVFVGPMKGAVGELSSDACDGEHSVKLQNPHRYLVEPANNWSQNILEPLGGKTLAVSGSVKTAGATEAAIWVQSYRKKPWGMLSQQSTADDTPLRGDMNWTPVLMHVDVPKGTDFVVVRCVLKGEGTVWFDKLSVTEESPSPKPPGATPPAATAAEAPKPIEMPVIPTVPMPELPKLTKPDAQKSIIDSQEGLKRALDELRKSNDALKAKVKAIQDELDRLRDETKRLKEEAGKAQKEAAPEKEAPVHTPTPPLVPHPPDAKATE